MAFLADQGLKHSTIKAYLSGLRFSQIHMNLGNPFQLPLPRLEYVLTGIKRVLARRAPLRDQCLPITIDIMQGLRHQWKVLGGSPDESMLWAAACVGFFAFLRAGEFTVPSESLYDPEVHLNLADVSVDSHIAPSVFSLRVKQSKTDPFRLGVSVYIGATQSEICPVAALLDYLQVRHPNPGPLFVFQSGKPLSRSALVHHLQAALQQEGIPASNFKGHSFRIGAATTAARCGLEDSLIQTLGRWKSAAYLSYIRIPREQLVATSARLVAASSPRR